ncbi:MAG TPA: class I SAM-dependent methyltransferase [Anaerolineales bacterium]|nr:class I SAM-dependent methyltransferase [Anaerolineales bacterium]
MSRFRDPIYLISDQYKDTGNLNARIQLHERYSTNPYGWFRWVRDQIDLPPEAHILELGCGSGKLWSENVDRTLQGWKIALSDFSYGMVHSCRSTLANKLDQFRFVASNAIAIPFPAATFDAVIANHMLFHIADRSLALVEIARVLKPNGTLYAATNGENHLLELDDMIEQNYGSSDGILPGKPSRGFCLENGAAQLSPWFRQVERRDYPDSLEVTDAEPLLAYIYSMVSPKFTQGGESSRSRLERVIKELLHQQGCIQIQKSSGMFIGKK